MASNSAYSIDCGHYNYKTFLSYHIINVYYFCLQLITINKITYDKLSIKKGVKYMQYIEGKGYLVGCFNEEELIKKNDKVALKKAMEETGLKFVNTEYIKKGKNIIGLKIYVCTQSEVQNWGTENII